MKLIQSILFLTILSSCVRHHEKVERCSMSPTSHFIVFLVDAPHLDYRSSKRLFQTMVKHPNGSKQGDVGHAWIYLSGCENGERIWIEGGHSGERGINQARYFEGVMNAIECGNPNPHEENLEKPCKNPIHYLWEPQRDGFFQRGSGGHRPTYAAKVNITPKQFHELLHFIENYPYENYSLTERQCSTFIVEAAALIGIELDAIVEIPIDQSIRVDGETLILWHDPEYSKIHIASPDKLEKELVELVREGRAEPALLWYLRHTPRSRSALFETLKLFPFRYARFKQFTTD